MRYLPYQLVQDFFHQQYDSCQPPSNWSRLTDGQLFQNKDVSKSQPRKWLWNLNINPLEIREKTLLFPGFGFLDFQGSNLGVETQDPGGKMIHFHRNPSNNMALQDIPIRRARFQNFGRQNQALLIRTKGLQRW